MSIGLISIGRVNQKSARFAYLTRQVNLMANRQTPPREFQVLSIEPELKLRCFNSISEKICFLLLISPFILIFIGHCAIFLIGIYELIHLRWQSAIYIFSYARDNPWYMLYFIFAFLLLGLFLNTACWSIFGVTEIVVNRESLKIIHKMFDFTYGDEIPAREINYFHQFINNSGEASSWDLEVVSHRINPGQYRIGSQWLTPEMLTRISYKVIHLYTHPKPEPSVWLGRILAEFYQVEFKITDE